jgi:hypothetical protein
MSPRPTADALPDLRGLKRALDAQDYALATGDLLDLPRIGARISALCDRIERHAATPGPSERALASQLRKRAAGSLRGLEAGLAGLRDAQALLQAARTRRPDTTYGADGQRQTIAPAASLLERRA